jgi:hypothetical protein
MPRGPKGERRPANKVCAGSEDRMNLHRISKDPISDHDASSQEFWPKDGKACLDFRDFTAREQGSHFRATFDWSDVESLIRVFADANHPEAGRLVQAQKLASAIVDLMRISN